MRTVIIALAVLFTLSLSTAEARPVKFQPTLKVSWSDGAPWEDTLFDEELFTWEEEGIPEIRVRTRTHRRSLAVLEYQDDNGRWVKEDASRLRRGRTTLEINPWCEVPAQSVSGTPHTDGSPATSNAWSWCDGEWSYRVRVGRWVSSSVIIAFEPRWGEGDDWFGDRPDITDLP